MMARVAAPVYFNKIVIVIYVNKQIDVQNAQVKFHI
jgi:hypothetical protein